MLGKIENLIKIAVVFLALLLCFSPLASAACSNCGSSFINDARCGSQEVTGNNCTNKGIGFEQLIHTIVNIMSILIGAIAIIMILVAGFSYVTSGGDSTKVESAKSTLLYAVIGLVIAALAQLIVHLALSTATHAT